MSFLDSALGLAGDGFHVFPLVPNSKLPAIKDYPNRATRDTSQIAEWWKKNPSYNVGISTTRFLENEALLVVDVDNKGDKKGNDEILRLELEGLDLPRTWEQGTPTGGRHLFFRVPAAVKQGTNVLGLGLDIRSHGGYVVGAGSSINGRPYTAQGGSVAASPEWLVQRCGRRNESSPKSAQPAPLHVNQDSALARALHYLRNEAPLAVEGQGGDQTTFQVAARVKDFGVDVLICYEIMLHEWSERCSPPWAPDELERKIQNAYRYGQEPVGAAAPETQFDPVPVEPPKPKPDTLHPFKEINREFAYVIIKGGDEILWETTDEESRFQLVHLQIETFHRKIAARTMDIGEGKQRPQSELWMKSPDRREYDGYCFAPGQETPPRFYNLWRGFAVDPLAAIDEATERSKRALSAWLEHAEKNICGGDKGHAHWLITYLAHAIQKPWERPNVALVLRGKKGVGKNAFIERVGHLFGNHFGVVAKRRHMTGNFNSILENKVMLELDEAFWSGDKEAEGVLKALVTGQTHLIERKGKEPYEIKNCLRLVILSNEDWVVPASEDERRFAIFDVGSGRRQDLEFFQEMREGMETGGYRLLLRYLLDFDTSKANPRRPPQTKALLDQKLMSLKPIARFWKECLDDEKLAHSEFQDTWPEVVSRESFRNAVREYLRKNNIAGWTPNDVHIGRAFRELCASAVPADHWTSGVRTKIYRLPPIEIARQEFEAFVGHPIEWKAPDSTDPFS